MSVLLDQCHHRALKKAWKKRMAERNIPRSSSIRMTKAQEGSWIAIATAVLIGVLGSICFGSSSSDVNTIRLILVCLSCGGLITGALHLRLFSLRDAEILCNSPIDDKLALTHTLRGFIPFSLIALFSGIGIALIAHSEIAAGDSVSTTIFAVLLSLVLSVSLMFIIALRIYVLWTIILSITLLVGLWVASFIPNSDASLLWMEPGIAMLLPPAWPIVYIHTPGIPEYFWLQILCSLGLMIAGASYFNTLLQGWRCPRQVWDAEFDEELAASMDADDSSPFCSKPSCDRDYAHALLQQVSDPTTNSNTKHGWIEKITLAMSGTSQQALIEFTGLNQYSRMWKRGYLLALLATLIWLYYPDHFLLSGFMHAAPLWVMIYANAICIPLGSTAGIFTTRINLNLQSEAPICTLFPIGLTQVWRLRFTEWWVRGLAALPLVTFSIWAIQYSSGDAALVTRDVVSSAWQGLFLIVAFLPLSSSLSVMFGSNTSNYQTNRGLYTATLCLLAFAHASVSALFFLMIPVKDIIGTKFVFLGVLLVTSSALFALAWFYYRSKETDLTFMVQHD